MRCVCYCRTSMASPRVVLAVGVRDNVHTASAKTLTAALTVTRSPQPHPLLPGCMLTHRAFRLYLSCKAGKTAALRATPRHAVASLLRRRGLLATATVHKAPSAGARGSSSTTTTTSSTAISGGVGSALLPPQVEREIAEEVFFATLVTTVGRVDRTLTMYDDSAASHGGAGLNTFHANANAAAAAADAAGGAAAQGATGDAWSGIPRLPLPGLGRGGRGGGGGGGGGGGEWRRGPGEAFHYGASPFPEVERFIESVCKEVRAWLEPAHEFQMHAWASQSWAPRHARFSPYLCPSHCQSEPHTCLPRITPCRNVPALPHIHAHMHAHTRVPGVHSLPLCNINTRAPMHTHAQ